MIDFRYHVVSIVAVFLALAIGIVLGSTELRGAAYNLLNSETNNLSNDLSNVRAQRAALQQEVSGDQAFAQAAQARLLDGLLTGERVVVVTAPGAPGQVTSGVSSALQKAGATVTGQVNMQPRLLDASGDNQSFLSTLVQTLATPGGTQVSNGTGLQQAAQLLGSVILTKTDPSANSSAKPPSGQPDIGPAVLSSYARAGLLNVSGHPENPATLAVVVMPGSPPPGSGSDTVNQSLVTLAQELSTAGVGTVAVSSISGSVSGSAIDALRGSNASSSISTVDDADTTVGQIVTAEVLQEALTGHKAGAYGLGPGSTAAAPSPAPTPSLTTPASQVTGSQAPHVHNASASQANATKSSKGHK